MNNNFLSSPPVSYIYVNFQHRPGRDLIAVCRVSPYYKDLPALRAGDALLVPVCPDQADVHQKLTVFLIQYPHKSDEVIFRPAGGHSSVVDLF